MPRFHLTISLFFFPFVFFAQSDSTSITLSEVTVSVARLQNALARTPASISSVPISKLKYAQPQFSINETLNEVPGLFALNPNNFAQDLRVSIRGFGTRSSFGIRGVKIIVDGIPETTPDGQGQVDNLDLGLIQNLEILRGPSAGLYGNASGGVIRISTQQNVAHNFLEMGTSAGSFGRRQFQLKTGFKKGKNTFILNGAHNRTDGFREHGGMKNNTFSANFNRKINGQSALRFLLNFTASPLADDPGGITLEDLNADRKQARAQNLQFDAGEAVRQFKTAILYAKQINETSHLEVKNFYIHRNFQGRLPFGFGGMVDLERHFAGHGVNHESSHRFLQKNNRLQVGYDLQFQRDNRRRFFNEEGEKGSLTFHQAESFATVGIFAVNQMELSEKTLLSANLRYDFNRLSAGDEIPGNGDASGATNLSSVNGSLGLSHAFAASFVCFGRFSTSFETPALSELSANPSGQEGFNNSLEAQTARSFEVGAKGLLRGKFRYELVYFHIRTKDEILPFEIAAFPERDFFRNAGATRRNGVETSAQWSFSKRWLASLNYTFSDFQFSVHEVNGEDLRGKNLPGIPQHFGALSLRYIAPDGLFFKIQTRMVGPLFLNDLNSKKDAGYAIVNFNLGYEKESGKWSLIPFLGVNNLLDMEYNDNVRVNAFGGRYFEPAAGINFYGGVRMRIGK